MFNDFDLNKIYQEPPRRTFTLDSCYKLESKTRQYPFVVASEVDSSNYKSSSDIKNNTSEFIPTPIEDLVKAALTGDFLKLKTDSIQDEFSKDTDVDVKFKRNSNSSNSNSEEKSANREFLVFHDIEHFLTQKDEYPNCHEIIKCPYTLDYQNDIQKKVYRDDLCKGRLLFDFDLKDPLPEMESFVYFVRENKLKNSNGNIQDFDTSIYVPSDFKVIIEQLIIETFQTYYIGVDTSKLIFVWQVTKHSHKFSMHLIVKNAYFSEYWVKQMRTFYVLFKRIAYINNKNNLMPSVDFQLPKRNCTFRMIGSSKIGGKTLELESYRQNGNDLFSSLESIPIYDCFVGIYHGEQLKTEQCISLDNLNYSEIEDQLEESVNSPDSKDELAFRKGILKNVSFNTNNNNLEDVTDIDVNSAVKIFNDWNDGTFQIRDNIGDIINLNRCRKGACRVNPQCVHERENAYLKLRKDGHLIFICRRGCMYNKSYGIDIGIFRQPKKVDDGLNINTEVLLLLQSAQTAIYQKEKTVTYNNSGMESEKKSRRKIKTSAKRVTFGMDVVQIPSFLKAPPKPMIIIK